MPHALAKLAGVLFVTTVLAAAGVTWWDRGGQARAVARLEAEKATLVAERAALETVVERLSAERRVAEVLVTDQSTVGGALQTDLLFVEYARDGRPLPPKRFTVTGDVVHVAALVVKFDRAFVRAGDGLRGRSVALFTRLYGEHQSPADGFPIDPPGEVPAAYSGDGRASDPAAAFERSLWRDFWRLADDPAFARSKGVRVAHGQSVFGMFRPGRLYTLALEHDGGLSLASEPLRGIYQEAMRK